MTATATAVAGRGADALLSTADNSLLAATVQVV
jgi:hypothetical protein